MPVWLFNDKVPVFNKSCIERVVIRGWRMRVSELIKVEGESRPCLAYERVLACEKHSTVTMKPHFVDMHIKFVL
jgi:hypothetical protein